MLWDNRIRLVGAMVAEAREILEVDVFWWEVEEMLDKNEFIGKAGTA